MSAAFNASAKNISTVFLRRQLTTLLNNARHEGVKEIFETYPDLDPDIKIVNDTTVLDSALLDMNIDLARFMLEKGANAGRHAGSVRMTPLMKIIMRNKVASKEQSEAFVDLLLKYRADVNAADDGGDTALHWAIRRDVNAPCGIIRRLIAAQADPFCVNHKGQTAFHLGACCLNVEGMTTLLELLEEKTGRNPLAAPNTLTGMTPIQEAQAAHIDNKDEQKAQMLQFLSDHARQRQRRVLAAANGATRALLPALPRIGRKP